MYDYYCGGYIAPSGTVIFGLIVLNTCFFIIKFSEFKLKNSNYRKSTDGYLKLNEQIKFSSYRKINVEIA